MGDAVSDRGQGIGSRLAGLTPSGRARVPVAWALYDFANTMFSFAIVSGAISLWLTDDARFGERTGQLILGIVAAVSVGLNALVSPALGALSDRGGRRLPFLFVFTALCVALTALIGPAAPVAGAILYIGANFAYQGALVYYDATIRTVSLPATRGMLSGIGVAIGYMGTISIALAIFLFDVPVVDRFLLVAILFGLFALPIFVFVREPGEASRIGLSDLVGAWGQLPATIRHARAVPGLLRFLAARFFYSDAVNTVIVVMSVVAVRAKGLTEREANVVMLVLAIVAIVASVGWGRLVDRVGPKRTLTVVLGSWVVGLLLGAAGLGLDGPVGLGLFVLAGAVLGSGLGGVQVSDRVFLVRLAPPERLGEFFGLYGLAGKASQVIGLLLYGLIIDSLLVPLGTGAYQVAILSLLVTLVIGAVLLRPVSDGSDAARDPAQPLAGAPPIDQVR